MGMCYKTGCFPNNWLLCKVFCQEWSERAGGRVPTKPPRWQSSPRGHPLPTHLPSLACTKAPGGPAGKLPPEQAPRALPEPLTSLTWLALILHCLSQHRDM